MTSGKYMTKIIYHKNCYDGFTAAWVTLRALQDTGVINIELFPVTYGDDPVEVNEDDKIYIVDFSYPRDILEKMHTTAEFLIVLDHHKTSQANCEGLDYCIFDMNRSGAGLAWDFFHPESGRPKLVNYVEDRDLWRFKLSDSRTISSYIGSWPMDFEKWDSLAEELENDVTGCLQQGQAIERYSALKVNELCKQVQWKEIGGYTIPVVNAPYHMGSDIGHRLLELYPEAPFAAYYLFTASGDEQWGVRGRDSDDFDVSEIAKLYGGGGHKKASGFLMNRRTRS
jgi:uncharacterized protein